MKNKIKYILQKTEFDIKSKRCRITVTVEREYRLLLKYDKNDDPVFSEPKIATRTIFKNVILNKNNILSLNHHEDEIIRILSFEIIDNLKEHNIFIPKWYIIEAKDRALKKNNENKDNDFKKLEERKKEKLSLLDEEQKKINSNKAKYDELFNKFNSETSIRRRENISAEMFAIKNKKKIAEQNSIIINRELLEINLEKISSQKQYNFNENKILLKFKEDISRYKEDELLLDEFNDVNLIMKVELPASGIIIVYNNVDDKYFVTSSKDISFTIKKLFSEDSIPLRKDMYKDYLNQLNPDIRRKMFGIRIAECSEAELETEKELLMDEYDRFRSGYQE